MDKAFVAQGVANKLFATEKAVDAAIAEAAGLLTGLIEARQQLELSATFGDATSAKLAQAVAQLAEVRSTVVQAHEDLDGMKLRLGIRTKMFGTIQKDNAAADPLTRAA